MTTLRVPYLVTKGGRHYWQPSAKLRAHWPARRLSDDLAQAMSEARAINADLARWRDSATGAAGTVTIADLIAAYRRSRFFLDKRAKTRKGYGQNLAVIAAEFGALSPRAVTAGEVNRLYERLRARTPAKANAVVTMLRILLDRSRVLYPPSSPGHVADNPAARLALVGRPPAGRIWPEAAIDSFVAAAEDLDLSSVGTAVMVNEWLGQRQGDFLRLSQASLTDGVLYLTQSKRGRKLALPVALVPEIWVRLKVERDRQRRRGILATTLIASERTGRPWNEDAFGKAFRQVRRACGEQIFSQEEGSAETVAMADLQFMHLRHTAVTRLFDAGVAREDIPAITGHSSKAIDGILQVYRFTTLAQATRAFGQRLDGGRT